MKTKISRRKAIEKGVMGGLATLGSYAFAAESLAQDASKKKVPEDMLPFRISMNTSTLMAYKLPVDQQIDMVAEAGFGGIELWMRDIMAFLEAGGDITMLKDKLDSGNLVLENIIGFSEWCSDDAQKRTKAINQLREEMLIIAQLGGKYVAAPVMGLESFERSQLDVYAQRYREILELEKETGVIPVIEIWGSGKLNKVADCTHIVLSSGHPSATMLLDFYHVYRGGNDWDTLHCLNGKRLPVIHMNDYPASPPQQELTDAHRLFPGEGICPFNTVLPQLYKAGFRGGLSVELFNKEYWASMDAQTILKTSYDKTRQVIVEALKGQI
ncbi:MAG: sugar phosphate isomerase/epimerase family protein [Flavobacteriaceae bacterium]